jgi:orotate phosphoribosyltransferase
MGGLIVGYATAAALDVPFRFTERKEGEMVLRRGFELSSGERVVIVEDVVTTGKSTLETVAIAESAGAKVVGLGSIIDRTGGDHAFVMPFRSLVTMTFPTYDAACCPLCAAGGAPEKPGSRGAV